MLVVATAIALQVSAAIVRPAPVDEKVLVSRARAARLQQDSLLASYQTMARQRMSFSVGVAAGLGLGPIGRARVAARLESVARVRGRPQSGAWAEILASRAVVPIVGVIDPDAADDDVS